MTHNIPIELIELKDDIINGMMSYMEHMESDYYTKEHVDKCEAILLDYLTGVLMVSIHGDTETIMATVEKVIITLNVLNEDCNYSLIETDQREGICELIINAAAQAGLESDEYDITEAWREW